MLGVTLRWTELVIQETEVTSGGVERLDLKQTFTNHC